MSCFSLERTQRHTINDDDDDDDDDVYFPLTHYYLQDMNHSNYLQLLPIMKS